MSDKRFPANIISSTPVEPSGSFEDSSASGTWSLQEAFSYVKAGLWPTAGNQKPLIEDLFSTYLYTGNGSTQTITNDIDLAGEGGLVWTKARNVGTFHALTDTERGGQYALYSSDTSAQVDRGSDFITSFNSDGYSIGADGLINDTYNYASWTFRKAPRFFDVVTWTGDAVAGRTISHDLGVEPGCIIVKRLNGADNWTVYHRGIDASAPENYTIYLNTTEERADQDLWADTAPTDAVFSVGDNIKVNGSGSTYVAYLFAHDPLGPSEDGSDGLIACGSYTGTGAAGLEVNLGWEPQWFLMKRTDTAGSDWFIFDVMRGFTTDGDRILRANTSEAESDTTAFVPTPTGVKLLGTFSSVNASGGTYIYIAIRRGPMRAPTSGTEVYNAGTVQNNTGRTILPALGYPVDWVWDKNPGTASWNQFSRLTGGFGLTSDGTRAESNFSVSPFDNNTTVKGDGWAALSNYGWMFRRAPGFFDVVAYSGNSSTNTLNHNLGVAPEMIVYKARNGALSWRVHANITSGGYDRLVLDSSAAKIDTEAYGSTKELASQPTATQLVLGNGSGTNNSSSYNYIAYLFATLPGVSKVGSYTGNGSSQTINCGFTSGARFILIKRTDSTGDWYVWDSARGIVAGNDPHLSLNTTAAEVTTDDSVDAESSGFIVNQDAGTNVNVDTASYIFLAIA
jgi:hypothetical protein